MTNVVTSISWNKKVLYIRHRLVKIKFLFRDVDSEKIKHINLYFWSNSFVH